MPYLSSSRRMAFILISMQFINSVTAFLLPQQPRSFSSRVAATSSIIAPNLNKDPIIIFPAQFGVEADYVEMIEQLNARGHPAKAVNLSRFDWLKITKSVPTAAYWNGMLEPKTCLKFYFEAAQQAVDEIKTLYPNKKINLVGHSIGGWIARAYLGEVADPEDVNKRFLSLTTLGTPNYPPGGDGLFARIDQTRGLLSYVTNKFPGAYHNNLRYVSVSGVSIEGKMMGGVEETVAFVSYLPLCGRGDAIGDGIVPEDIAFLEGAIHVKLPDCKHSSFIPTAGPSIKIPNYTWYGSPEIVDQWILHLPEGRRLVDR